MERVESASKIDNQPKSKFHVGDEVYISIMDYRGLLQRRGPYLIAKVLGGGKYTLCYYNGDNTESGKEIDEKTLVTA